MAASNTDLLKKLARRWVGQIGAGGVADASVTTVPLSSTTNLPTDTAVAVVIDRVDSSGTSTPSLEETIIGVVSGSNLVTCTRGVEGTAQAHSAGAVVEVLVTNKGYNDIIDALLVGHTQLGAHIASLPLTTPKITTSINDSNGNEVIKTPATGSAVNEITVTNAATGNAPLISATGGDTDLGLTLASKGTGVIKLKSGSTTTNGHTVPNVADDTVTLIAATQTLTNKTLTSPVINTGVTGTGGFNAWAAWTPTLTGITKGAGTLTCTYIQIGKTVIGRLSFVFAADSSVTGQIGFSLPVTSVSYPATATINTIGSGMFYDASVDGYRATVQWLNTTTAYMYFFSVSGTKLVNTGTSSTVPFTWTTSDEIKAEFTYEAA